METGILIIVEDNGDELGDDELDSLRNSLQQMDKNRECTGILNINMRIKLIYGDYSGVSVYRSDSGGLKVCMTILTGEETRCTDF